MWILPIMLLRDEELRRYHRMDDYATRTLQNEFAQALERAESVLSSIIMMIETKASTRPPWVVLRIYIVMIAIFSPCST